jgi:PAS domain S-box-containing protein
MDQKEFSPLITRSHERCRSFGVDPKRKYSARILTGLELTDHLARKQWLIDSARPYIDELYRFVKGTNFFLILTDEEGCILYIVGDPENMGRAKDLKMIPGAYMSEEHIGTNAMGTALAEGAALQVTGEEHYIQAYHRWTCSGAVIRDPGGSIIGSLDMTGNEGSVHAHTLGMVVSAVHAIENHLVLEEKNRVLTERHHFISTLMDAIGAGIMACDLDGSIRTVNKEAQKMFGYRERELTGMKMGELIGRFDEIREQCTREEAFLGEELQINARINVHHYNVSAYPVHDGRKVNGLIFVLRDVKKVRKMANQIVGRRAIYTFDKIIGNAPAMREAIRFSKKVANSRSTILITGESGTGKEVFAHAIQNESARREENFMVVNCASIPRNLIESELFGYEEGAFTGAKSGGQPGKFEIADGGTLFLDEIGEMRLDMQTRLLRVIQEGVITRVGGNEVIPVNVRLIAATNKDLAKEVERGNFRLDLYYRLNVLPIHLPALRERAQDIPLLIDYFVEKISKKLNKKPIPIPHKIMEHLMAYEWPGNVRELENFVELMINTERIPVDLKSPSDQASDVRAAAAPLMSLEEVEHHYIRDMLRTCDFNISEAARILGVGRNTLYRKMNKYDIDCS